MPRCLRTERAEEDLIEIWLTIATENPTAADRQLDRIQSVFETIARYPEIGPFRPDLAPELRYFVVGRYLVLYRQMTDGVEIVRVVHGARHIPDLI